MYGIVDVSGTGFGSSFGLPGGTIAFQHGVWGKDSDSKSSNFRELSNLVEAIKVSATTGALDDAELFVFTDNSTAEGAFYKGNSPNRKLFELVL